jgi:DNA-binding transcriptional LysR family regulator
MELRHFRYFVAVAEELHFRPAAERLHVAQPAVSEQVRKLEEELGVRLFNRTQRSVSLTDAGTALLDEARRVLHQAEVARMAARNARDSATTRLRLGHVPDSLPTSVARAMQIFGMTAPRVQISLETGPAGRLIGEVRAERLDVAVVGLPAPTSGLRATPAGSQRIMAALPVTHPHAVGPAVSLARLAPPCALGARQAGRGRVPRSSWRAPSRLPITVARPAITPTPRAPSAQPVDDQSMLSALSSDQSPGPTPASAKAAAIITTLYS